MAEWGWSICLSDGSPESFHAAPAVLLLLLLVQKLTVVAPSAPSNSPGVPTLATATAEHCAGQTSSTSRPRCRTAPPGGAAPPEQVLEAAPHATVSDGG